MCPKLFVQIGASGNYPVVTCVRVNVQRNAVRKNAVRKYPNRSTAQEATLSKWGAVTIPTILNARKNAIENLVVVTCVRAFVARTVKI